MKNVTITGLLMVSVCSFSARADVIKINNSTPEGSAAVYAMTVLARASQEEPAKTWISAARITGFSVDADPNQRIHTYIFNGILGMSKAPSLKIEETITCSEPSDSNGGHGGCDSTYQSSLVRK